MRSQMYIGLHVKQPLFCRILIEIFRHIFEKHLNITFYKNPSSWSRVVPYGRTDGQTDRRAGRRTDMMKLIVALRNFESAPKSNGVKYCVIHQTLLCFVARMK
jgi:hypothetical protein